ncbi:MAG: hypothetical protein ACRDR6_19100 [Pseudonocardiaceae bacterium]
MNSENDVSGPRPGQYDDHCSYSRRPIRNAAADAIPSPMIVPMASSKYGKCHLSGDSTTPSREMKKFETILPMTLLLEIR